MASGSGDGQFSKEAIEEEEEKIMASGSGDGQFSKEAIGEEEEKMMKSGSRDGQFSEEAIDRLMERVNGEEEEEKSGYLCVFSRARENYEEFKTPKFSWYKCDSSGGTCVDDDMIYKNSSFPSDLTTLVGFRCTVWKSKIYLVGGYHNEPSEVVLSDKAFIYDTVSQQWQTTVMNYAGRDKITSVVAAGDMVFVFGGSEGFSNKLENLLQDPLCNDRDKEYLNEEREIALREWSEFCVATDQTPKWHYLPKPPPIQVLHFWPMAHVVCQQRNQILFWIPQPQFREGDCLLVVSFDYKDKVWTHYQATQTISRSIHWTYEHAVIQDFVFWFDGFGKIFAHHLTSDVTSELCDLNLDTLKAFFGFRFAHIGKGTLALFYTDLKHSIFCKSFQVQKGSGFGAPTILLRPNPVGSFHASYSFPVHALGVPS